MFIVLLLLKSLLTFPSVTEIDLSKFKYTNLDMSGRNSKLLIGLAKKRLSASINFIYSVLRSIRSIESCYVALLLIDAVRGFESQDQKIFDLIFDEITHPEEIS